MLEQAEIRILAADMCSVEELRLGASIILTWDDVLKNERTGNITEIVLADCDYNERFKLIWKDLERTNKDLNRQNEQLQGKLNSTHNELSNRLEEVIAKQMANESKSIMYRGLTSLSLLFVRVMRVSRPC